MRYCELPCCRVVGSALLEISRRGFLWRGDVLLTKRKKTRIRAVRRSKKTLEKKDALALRIAYTRKAILDNAPNTGEKRAKK